MALSRVILLILVGFTALVNCSLPSNEQNANTNDALKKFLMRNNRLPYANETAALVDGATTIPPVRSWTTCEGCKLLVMELRSIINNPQEVENLKELLTRTCDLGILSKFKAECLNMVNNLILVLHEIEPILDNPTAVCQELQYCPESLSSSISAGQRIALLIGYKFIQLARPSRVNDVACDECIFAISELKSLIQSQSIKTELKAELHKICHIAGQYETECDALVDQYFDLLIQELVELLGDGRQVCADFGFCQSTGRRATVPLTRVRISQVRPSQVSSRTPRVGISGSRINRLDIFEFTARRLQTRQGINAGCLICREGFTKLIEALRDDRTALKISNELTKFVCDLVPTNLKPGCTDFMKIYSRSIIEVIAREIKPEEICTDIGMCKADDNTKISQLSVSDKAIAVCEACELLSQYFSFEFKQPDFQQEIVSVLKQGCTIFPGDYATQCDDALVNYVPVALNFLADFLDRNVLCATTRMCPGNRQTTPRPAST